MLISICYTQLSTLIISKKDWLKTPLQPEKGTLRNSIVAAILVVTKKQLSNHINIQVLYNRIG